MYSAPIVALIVFVTLASALEIWLIVGWRRTRYTFLQAILYLVNICFTRILWRTKVSGQLPVSDDQGAVIVSNHCSGVDPLVIQLCTDRVVHWMVAREYYEMPGIAVVFHSLGSISVNRGGIDTASTKMAIRLAQKGDLVGLFPEGRVNVTDDLLLPGRPGAALIALRARVPVIPCYVTDVPYDGTALGSFFMSGKARVVVGKPIDLSEYYGREGDKKVLEELTRKFLIEIARLAGVEHFVPKVAGKHWKPGDEELAADHNGDNMVAPDMPAPDMPTTSANGAKS